MTNDEGRIELDVKEV